MYSTQYYIAYKYLQRLRHVYHLTPYGLNAMYVRDVGDGVCAFYATLYAEYRFMSKMSKILCIQWPLAPPEGKACCSRTVRPVGLAVHHHAV